MSSVAFDVEGARKAGYSNGEIATFLASKKGFDIDGARSAGYGDEEIIGHLLQPAALAPKAAQPGLVDRGLAVMKNVGSALLDPMGQSQPSQSDRIVAGANEIAATQPGRARIVERGAPVRPEVARKMREMPAAQVTEPWQAGVQAAGRADAKRRRENAPQLPNLPADSLQQSNAVPSLPSDGYQPSGTITGLRETLADGLARRAVESTGSAAMGTIVRDSVDLVGSLAKVAPTTGKLIFDTAQLAPIIGQIAEWGSDAMADVISDISRGQSADIQAKASRLAELARDGNGAQVAEYLLAHPDLLADVAIPSAGSMYVIGGVGRLVGNQAAASLPATVSARARERIRQRAAEQGAMWANIAANAGSAFAETDGPASAKYLAALIAGAGTRSVAKITGGGAEGAIARGPGAVAANPVAQVAGIAGREAGQEFVEGASESIGSQTGEYVAGTRDDVSLRQAINQGTIEALAAGPTGGAAGVTVAAEAMQNDPRRQIQHPVDAAIPPTESQPAETSVAPQGREILRNTTPPHVPALAASADPLENMVSALEQEALGGMAPEHAVVIDAARKEAAAIDQAALLAELAAQTESEESAATAEAIAVQPDDADVAEDGSPTGDDPVPAQVLLRASDEPFATEQMAASSARQRGLDMRPVRFGDGWGLVPVAVKSSVAVGSVSSTPVLRANGTPFPSAASARASARQRGLDMHPVEVDGGWGLVSPAVLASASQPTGDAEGTGSMLPSTSEAPAGREQQALSKQRRKSAAGRDVLSIIRAAGGIKTALVPDITGERNSRTARAPVGLFAAGGMDVDMLAELLEQNGFLVPQGQGEAADTENATAALELVQRALGGERILSFADADAERSEVEERAYRDDVRRQASEAGIRYVGRRFADVERDVVEALNRKQRIERSRLEQSEQVLLDELIAEMRALQIDDEAALEVIALEHQDSNLREYRQALEAAFAERIASAYDEANKAAADAANEEQDNGRDSTEVAVENDVAGIGEEARGPARGATQEADGVGVSAAVARRDRAADAAAGRVTQEADVYEIREPEGSVDLFPELATDLFAGTGDDRDRRESPGAGDVRSSRSLSVRQAAGRPGIFNVTSQLVSVGERELPVSKVTTTAEAAAALRHLSRFAVEHYDALVTDVAGRPLAVIGSFKGAATQTSVFPSTVLQELARIEGAAHLWSAHNHPSGAVELSQADELLSNSFAQRLQDSGVEYHGLLAIAGSRYASTTGERGVIPPTQTMVSVPIVERMIEGTPGEVMSSPESAKQAVRRIAGEKTGVFFLSAQNAITAFVPMAGQEMMPLRRDGRLMALFRDAASTNAAAAIIANPNEKASDEQIQNLSRALQLLDIRVLDVVRYNSATGEMQPSAAEQGVLPSGGPVFSRRGKAEDSSPSGTFEATARAYGGAAAHHAARIGGRTKLDYDQWVQVRTPEFKAWFGDWEALRTQQRLDAMPAVDVRIPDEWRGLSHVELRQRMAEALDRMVRERAEIRHPELGSIRIGRVGARKSEGSARDPAKSLVVADIESILPTSIYARSEPSRGGDGPDIDGYSTLLSRVSVAGVPLVAAFTVRHQSDGRWYYNAVTLHDGRKEEAQDSYGRPDRQEADSSDAPIAGLREFIRRPLTRVNPDAVSKVLDSETGEPLLVYHGTKDSGHTEFRSGEIFFSEDREVARNFALGSHAEARPGAKVRGPGIYSVFLNLRDPVDVDFKGAEFSEWYPDEDEARIFAAAYEDDDYAGGYPETTDSVVEAARALRADGAIIRNVVDIGTDATVGDSPANVFVVFRPEQIKSARFNSGAFDPASPDIRKSVARATGQALSSEELLSAVAARFPSLTKPVDTMLQRGTDSRRGGLVVLSSADPVEIARQFASRTGRTEVDALASVTASRVARRPAPLFDGKKLDAKRIGQLATEKSIMGFFFRDMRRQLLQGADPRDLVERFRQGLKEQIEYAEAQIARGTAAFTEDDVDYWRAYDLTLAQNAARFGYEPGSQPTDVRPLALSVDDELQGFYDPKSGLTFLIGPNLDASTGVAVLLHESTHTQERAELDARAMALIERRGTAAPPVRAFLERVRSRMADAGEERNAAEATAYIVEQAVIEGRVEGFSAIDGRFMQWIDRLAGKRVGDVLRDFVALLRRWVVRHGAALPQLYVDDLVELAKDDVRRAAAGDVRGGGSVPRSVSSAPEQQRAEPPEETLGRRVQRRWQDSFNRFTVVQEWLQEQGVDLTEQADVYRAEERMHGRIATRVEDFREKRVKPILKKIRAAGLSMAEVADFLHAQHAVERNQHVASVNQQMPDGGSGMSTAEATAKMGEYRQRPELVKLANELRSITDDTRAVLLQAGLITPEMAAAWTATYQHYVPLKGGPEEGASLAGTGKGLTVKERQKRALGHGERNEWIVENILRDHERAILQAEKNRVGQHLLKLAAEAGHPDLITIGKPQKRGVLRDLKTYEVRFHGSVVEVFHSLAEAQRWVGQESLHEGRSRKDFEISTSHDLDVAYAPSPVLDPAETQVYVAGHAVRIQFKDELLARAWNNMGAEQMNVVFRLAREVNNWLARAYTAYNPEFLLVNVLRDFTTGAANLTGERGAAFAAKTAAHYPKAFAQILRYAFTGKPSNDVKQFRADGGTTGAAYLPDLERIGREIEGAYDSYIGVMETWRTGGSRRAARAAARKTVGAFVGWIEKLNMAGENAMRLAAYKTALDEGWSRADAASLAKNATVNFNRKGELSQVMGALYLFFNPAVQGSASIAHALFKGEHKAQAQALTGALVALGYFIASAQGGGDEDEWEKLGEFTQSRYLPIWTGERWLKIPVPYGYGFFYSLGRHLQSLEKGEDRAKVGLRIASSFVEEFSVWGPAADVDGDEKNILFLLPTIPQMVLAPVVNRTGLGSPIYPESRFDESRPDSMKMWRTTQGTAWASMAQQINAITGGNAAEKGWADVSPETLRYLWTTATGGSGRFLADTAGLARNIAIEGIGPADIEAREVPLVRKFVQSADDIRGARSRFWAAAKEVREANEAFKRARKVEDHSERQRLLDKIRAERGELLALGRRADRVAKAVAAKRDAIGATMADESKPLSVRRALVKQMEREEARLYDDFVRLFKEERQEAREKRAAGGQ